MLGGYRHAVAWAVIALSAACSGPETPSPTQGETPAEGIGLRAVRERGKLRLITRNNGVSYYVLRGRPLGFDYELAQRFADRLGVELEVVVPASWDRVIPMLEAGEGDLVGAGLTITPERRKKIAFTDPYALTHMRVAWSKGQPRVGHIQELSGKRVHVRQSSAYYALLVEVSTLLERIGEKPITIVIESSTLETEKILLDVARGQIPYTLCDYHLCREIAAYSPDLIVGPPVSQPVELAWAVDPRAGDLLSEANVFLAEQRKRDLRELYRRYYEPSRKKVEWKLTKLYKEGGGQVSPYDDLMRSAADKYDFDWRLLASIAFQESRFDPKMRTRHGGRGLFGLHRSTMRAVGHTNPGDPRQATEAAAAHLSAMRGIFSQVPNEDDRLKFGLAAFQAGPEHLRDARLLASNQGLNPDAWADVAKVLPLLSLREFAKKAEHGFVRGAETVAYVNDVWEGFRAYRHASGARDRSRRKR